MSDFVAYVVSEEISEEDPPIQREGRYYDNLPPAATLRVEFWCQTQREALLVLEAVRRIAPRKGCR